MGGWSAESLYLLKVIRSFARPFRVLGRASVLLLLPFFLLCLLTGDVGFSVRLGVATFDCTLYPSEDFQKSWLEVYLKEFEGSDEETEADADKKRERVQRLYADVCKFAPVPHFMWAMWSLVQAHHSQIEFDYFE